MIKSSALLLGLVLLSACVTSPAPSTSDTGTRVIHRNAVLYQGPELVATVAYRQGKHSVAEEWLVLAVELTCPRNSGPIPIRRGDISVFTPEGRRLELASQIEFAGNFPRLSIPVDRALAFFPLLRRYEPGRLPSERWFYAIASDRIGFEELPVSSGQEFSGPLVFSVPGGVQPGRWRLVFELEESRPDIPFVIEVKR